MGFPRSFLLKSSTPVRYLQLYLPHPNSQTLDWSDRLGLTGCVASVRQVSHLRLKSSRIETGFATCHSKPVGHDFPDRQSLTSGPKPMWLLRAVFLLALILAAFDAAPCAAGPILVGPEVCAEFGLDRPLAAPGMAPPPRLGWLWRLSKSSGGHVPVPGWGDGPGMGDVPSSSNPESSGSALPPVRLSAAAPLLVEALRSADPLLPPVPYLDGIFRPPKFV
jgi:hypothetical protein